MHAILPPVPGRWPALRGLLLLFVVLASNSAGFAQEASFRDPERPWLAEGDSLVSVGEAASALESYRVQAEAHPEDPELWLRISALEVGLGDPAAALSAARQARRLDPEGSDPYLMLSQALFANGDGPGGLSTLEEGVTEHPDDIPLLEALTSVKIGTRKWGAAAGLLRQLMLLDPENAVYYMDLGRIQHQVGEMDEAYETLKRGLELGAPRAQALALLGHVCLAMGRLQEARGYLEESIRLEPSAEGWSGLAGVEFLESNAPASETAFRRALELDPQDADSWFNLGNAIMVQERPAEAETAFRRAIEVAPGPSSASARLNLGVLLLTRQAVQEAKEQFLAAIKANPAVPGPYLHLARIAGARFEFESARSYYELYRERVPDAEEKTRIQKIINDLGVRIAAQKEAQVKGEVHLLQIMTRKRDQADAAYARVKAGEDFYTVAEEVSSLASITGVDIGFVDPDALNAGFSDAIKSLTKGQYTAVLEGPNGWYLFQRVE